MPAPPAAFLRAATHPYRLQIFLGPMWSGKTNSLIQAVDVARQAYQRVVVVKHKADTRHPTSVVARTGLALPADVCVDSLADIDVEPGNSLYAVDEAQFFGESLLSFWARLAGTDHGLIVSGLDLDFRRMPFGSVLRLAEEAVHVPDAVRVERLVAACDHRDASTGAVCGARAPYSQRLRAGGEGLVQVGGAEFYAPACAVHHVPSPVDEAEWGRGNGRGGAGRGRGGEALR
jgi:thymidine kinase